MGTILLHTILSLMSPPLSPAEAAAGQDHDHRGGSHFGSSLTFPRSASVLGYCLLPLVLTSIVGIVVPMDSFFGYLLTSLAIIWCSYSSSSMFTVVGMCAPFKSLCGTLTYIYRAYDFNERTSSVPDGSILRKFWHHGNLQFQGYWTTCQGDGDCMRDYDGRHRTGRIIL